jgi:hypothetical protein
MVRAQVSTEGLHRPELASLTVRACSLSLIQTLFYRTLLFLLPLLDTKSHSRSGQFKVLIR